MKITNEQRELAEKLTKLHIRPAVVKQELLKLNPEVKRVPYKQLGKEYTQKT